MMKAATIALNLLCLLIAPAVGATNAKDGSIEYTGDSFKFNCPAQQECSNGLSPSAKSQFGTLLGASIPCGTPTKKACAPHETPNITAYIAADRIPIIESVAGIYYCKFQALNSSVFTDATLSVVNAAKYERIFSAACKLPDLFSEPGIALQKKFESELTITMGKDAALQALPGAPSQSIAFETSGPRIEPFQTATTINGIVADSSRPVVLSIPVMAVEISKGTTSFSFPIKVIDPDSHGNKVSVTTVVGACEAILNTKVIGKTATCVFDASMITVAGDKQERLVTIVLPDLSGGLDEAKYPITLTATDEHQRTGALSFEIQVVQTTEAPTGTPTASPTASPTSSGPPAWYNIQGGCSYVSSCCSGRPHCNYRNKMRLVPVYLGYKQSYYYRTYEQACRSAGLRTWIEDSCSSDSSRLCGRNYYSTGLGGHDVISAFYQAIQGNCNGRVSSCQGNAGWTLRTRQEMAKDLKKMGVPNGLHTMALKYGHGSYYGSNDYYNSYLDFNLYDTDMAYSTYGNTNSPRQFDIAICACRTGEDCPSHFKVE